MVGPVVRVDPASLPQAPNLHYFGLRPYGELPAFLAGWDVALLPYARSDATRFVSPIQTLEYMAAGCAPSKWPGFAIGWRASMSSSPAATARGSRATGTTRSWPAERPPNRHCA